MRKDRYYLISGLWVWLLALPVISVAEDTVGVATSPKGMVKLTRGTRHAEVKFTDRLFLNVVGQGTRATGVDFRTRQILAFDQVSHPVRNSKTHLSVRVERNQVAIGQSHIKQAAELVTHLVQALKGQSPTAGSKELAATIMTEPAQKFRLEDVINRSRKVKKVDSPAALITSPSEGGTVLRLPTP